MIKIAKADVPAVLDQNSADWTQKIVDALNRSEAIREADRFRYRHPDIKATLLQETHSKCAYCESKICHVIPGDIEHILPFSKRPDLAFSWENMTISCRECNRRKSDYYDEAQPLINPYKDDPAAHIQFHGPMPLHAPGDQLGRRTIGKLGLDRPDLILQRAERIRRLKDLIDLWAREPEGSDKSLLWKQIEEECSDDREYAAVVRAVIEAALKLASISPSGHQST